MITIIGIISFTLALVFGVKISTQDDMVLEKVGQYATRKLEEGNKVWEALVLCPYCLPSIWSSVGFAFWFLVFPDTSLRFIFAYPIVVGSTSLLSGLVWSIFELLWAKKSYYEKAEEKMYLEIKTMKENYNKNKLK